MDNADLGKLKLTPGKLVPKFKASVTEYSVIVASTIAETKLSPLTCDSGASYVIKGAADKVVKLTEGQTHTVEIIVTAEDGKSTKIYTILIRRLSADDASLSQLQLSAGILMPAFSPLITKYDCYLPNSIDSLSIRAKTEDEAMKLTMKDGSPVGTVYLNPSHSFIELSVLSRNGKSSTIYSIMIIKSRLPVTLQLKNSSADYECAICCGIVSCPTKVKGSLYVYCQACLDELTRTDKSDPFTGKKFGDKQWIVRDIDLDSRLAKEVAICPLPSGDVEAAMQEIGARLLAERLKVSQNQEPTQACADCSKKVPTDTIPLHKEKLCSAKHSNAVSKQEVKAKPWEQSLVSDSLSGDIKELLRKAEECEMEYLQILPKPGKTVHYPEGKNPLDYLHTAARYYASAIRASSKETKAHLGLGLVMEELFYAKDLYGLHREETSPADEGEAKQTSKEEEFLAICKLHGVFPTAPVAVQLKAVEAEYYSLKEAGQTHKAEHVQGLHAWKSKKILEASRGSYAVNTESPLYKAKLKLRDAVCTDPSDAFSCYHLGRLCLLLGDSEEAITYLFAALAQKPILSEARYCLGLALPLDHSSHAKMLLLKGLSEFLQQIQEVNESHPNPTRLDLKQLNSKILYRSSNPLMVDGFLRLAEMGGQGHLSSTHCLLAASSSVATASLLYRGSTFDKLLWGSLRARAALLNNLYQQKNINVLRHCQQLTALIAASGLASSPQVRELQMNVFELGVVLQPSSSEALCHLGNGQLAQYDATDNVEWLEDAEASFRASIAMEGKTISTTLVPEHLKSAIWWKKQMSTKAVNEPKNQVASVLKPAASAMPTKQPAAAIQKKPTGTNKPLLKKEPPYSSATKKPVATRGTTQTKTVSAKPGMRSALPARGKPAAVSQPRPATKPATTTQTTSKPPTSSKTAAPVVSKTGPLEQPTDIDSITAVDNKEVNKCNHQPRMGLARTLAKFRDNKKHEEVHSLYKEVITMAPDVHDAYIELGDMLIKSNPLEAVDIYCKFPFSDPPTFDDAFLHGEIVRLLMSTEAYDDPRLCKSMIAMGKALGIAVLEKQVAVLENKYKSTLLKQIYAGVHGKPIDDPDLQAFFKFKCWL